ncbi:MAG: trehalase family glycosidase [Candidatus Saccharimonadales bacterium]
MNPDNDLLTKAQTVLSQNDRSLFTVPASDLYPHQWLWDSCFIAIGLRHLDIERAQTELKSLLRGQWANGMLPHIIFWENVHRHEYYLWQSWLNPHAPSGLVTSGLTQPPMLAEAVLAVGQKLKLPDRRSWYRQMYPSLVKYHKWLYKERDPSNTGLVALLHPYESGLDNSPPWINQVRTYAWPVWLHLVDKLGLDNIAKLVRRDTRHIPAGRRMSNAEGIAYWNIIRRLRRQGYDSRSILTQPKLAVADLAFNCILIRANTCLAEIAKPIGESLPEKLSESNKLSHQALASLRDDKTGQFFSRDLRSGELIYEPSISSLLPLYSGAITAEEAEQLVKMLKLRRKFGANWPVPSVPINSSYFDPLLYWQGPTWANTNWLIIEGLRRYGYNDEADSLKIKTLQMVENSGLFEYFNPIDGRPAGAANFSWTAALTIDLLKY